MSFVPVCTVQPNLIGGDGPLISGICTALHSTAQSSTRCVERVASAGPAADGGASLTTPLIGGAVTIVVAVVGWLLFAWYRRRDHQRANLTETAETLEQVDLEVRRLTAAGGALTAADFADLRVLLLRIQRAADRCSTGRRLRPLEAALTSVSMHIGTYTGAAAASSGDVAAAYAAVASPADVPPHLLLETHVAQCQQQTRAAERLAVAVHSAEIKVEKLRAS
ncbi:hypothetical protein [Streptomyces sp. NPDC005407]|uniref:hypothetical protein n=1 Tax=Streptomyces sp. NPDC005407 TaxID=3155340 RepID=UPI0033B6E9F9